MHRDQDFEIHIAPTAPDTYTAFVRDSPFGIENATFEPPYFEEDAAESLAGLEADVGEFIEKSGRGPIASRLPELQQSLGTNLYQALMTAPVGGTFQQSLAHVEARSTDEQPVALRLLVGFDPQQEISHLAALPWELLFKPDTRDYLGRSLQTRLIRYLESRRQVDDDFTVSGKLKVLLIDSAPEGFEPLDTRAERRRIIEAVENHPSIEVESRPNSSLQDLHQLLRDETFHVLHFMGHGGFDESTGEGAVAFDAPTGQSPWVTATMLSEYLKGIRSLRLVLLSTCYGAKLPRHRRQHPFNSVAPALVMAGVPAVIAMQFPISDTAAIAFSEIFYTRLARYDPVDLAVAEGRLAIFGNRSCAAEWATPALFLRSRDGRIMAAEEPVERSARKTTPKPLHLGIWTGINTDGQVHGEMKAKADEILDLEYCFDEDPRRRQIRKPELWQTAVLPQTRDFLSKTSTERKPLLLDFVAPASIAFTAGYYLEEKSGLDVTVLQRMRGRTLEWNPQRDLRESPSEAVSSGRLWRGEPDVPGQATTGPSPRDILRRLTPGHSGQASAQDVALAVSITRPVLDDVQIYLEDSALQVGRIIPMTVPEPSGTSVNNGAHALALAQSISHRIESRTLPEKRGTLHLFIAAPNVVLFFLGQSARNFRRVQLYEFDFDRESKYYPSIRLPPGADFS